MRIGIVGYGHLGQYLVDAIEKTDDLELAFVWNRTLSSLDDLQRKDVILENLAEFSSRKADLIVEVAHPNISKEYGEAFLREADYMIGSPTALSDATVERTLRKAADKHGLYIPTGAFWGGEDIKKMADRSTLQRLKVTMKKHPSCFRLQGDLKAKNAKVVSEAVTLYEGPVRELCPLAPNNVNTMAAAASAAHNLGFDDVIGCLVSDPQLGDKHIVEVEVWGAGDIDRGTAFHVKTVRSNPAKSGVVTGSATSASFLSSMLGAHGRGPGVHLC